jgi:signal transduction histidine kinase
MGVKRAHEGEVLRQAGVALDGRIVTLWEISSSADAIPLVSGVSDPPAKATALDLDTTLRRWGAPIVQRSRWVGCRVTEDGPWVVAPVRSRPAAPPPTGTERRSRERLILELAGLSLGALAANAEGSQPRLSPAEALWDLSRQPSVIAHEVGNPLAVALGNLDLGMDALREASPQSVDPAFRAELLDDFANVAGGIEQAADYLRSIQDRPFGGVGRLGRFDVTPVVRSCVTLERPVARKRGVALQWESVVDSIFLYGDSGALYQVLTNLIRNAVDASRDRKATIVIAMNRLADTLRLVVRDQGIGIDPALLSRIFERGFTTKAGAGSGIGLAVVREITENMFGGRIEVESRLGDGTTFTLFFPIPPQRGAGLSDAMGTSTVRT